MKKQTLALTLTAVLGSSNALAAAVYPDFTVNEFPAAGAANEFTADKITGNYTETAKFTAGATPNTGTFTVSLLFNGQGFSKNDGTAAVAPLYLNSFEPNGYKMYGFYTAAGSFETIGTDTHFTFTSGAMELWIDKDSNTTFIDPKDGVSPILASGVITDDEKIGFGSTHVNGDGNLQPTNDSCTNGNNCGSFGVNVDFALTAFGSSYLTTPNPFYHIAFNSGVLNNFVPEGIQDINGVMNITFIPEPASLALLGIGMVGLGLQHRNKYTA